MRCRILHESSHRLRIRILPSYMTMEEADTLEYYLLSLSCVLEAKVNDRTADAVILYDGKPGNRSAVLAAMAAFDPDDRETRALVPEQTGRAISRMYSDRLSMQILWHFFRKFCLPLPFRVAWTLFRSIGFIAKGLRVLAGGHVEVPLLDAAAITASLLRGDFDTASSVMFLLDVGETLEEWTHRKSVDDLARSMELKVDQVWLCTDGSEVLTDVRNVRAGDRICVRTSNVIPLDGKVLEGEMTVNQASMTGESVPVEKHAGGYVYAGTVVEEGQCIIEVTKAHGSGKYDEIVRMIEESEKLKSETETRAFHLADRLVPYSLLGTAVTWLITRNVTRAVSFLMVDFSCALKLSMPLAVLSAIREAGEHSISVKGGRFLEAMARADTIVFDKTGTLTKAKPEVVRIVTFDGAEENEALRIAACLEEHYPHSVARAVTDAAQKRGLLHEEMHSRVDYVVAHGISSKISGEKACIGSAHFIFEDEGCTFDPEEKGKLDDLPGEYTHLFLAIGGRLKAALCIFDPLRPEAAGVVDELHRLGISKVCMMTGDNERTAAAVAAKLRLDEYHGEVLPDDKSAFIRRERAAGHKVIMIGDGVNDTPALSEADVGVAVSDGAAIAREVADITIAADDLEELVFLRRLSMQLMKRIENNYRFIVGFNGMLIALGIGGILRPASSALLHNASTVVTGLNSMTPLLHEETGKGGAVYEMA